MKRSPCIVAAAVAAFGIATAGAQEKRARIAIGTGGTSGVYYPLGGGLAAVLSKYVPGIDATAEVTAGSIANLQLIGGGKSELGFTMADSAWDAYNGLEKFKDKKVGLRTLVVFYPNRMQVATLEGKGIEKMTRPQGQAHLDRGARLRHRGHVDAPARGLWHRPQQGRDARAAVGRRIGERPQGRQDRRPHVGGRRSDAGAHRSRGHPGKEDQADRPWRWRRGHAQEIRPDLREEQDPRERLPGRGARDHERRRVEPARRAGELGREAGLRDHEDDVREEGSGRRAGHRRPFGARARCAAADWPGPVAAGTAGRTPG